MHELSATAKRLWYTASYWKYSVLGAGLFSLLFGIHLLDGSSSGSAPADPVRYAPAPAMSSAAPSDPASDARLADYQITHDQAVKAPTAGERCEKMVAALDLLTPDDLRRGRNPRASPPGLFKALADGESCRGSLIVSDRHYDSLDRAMVAADASRTPATVQEALSAFKALDAFDLPRTRFTTDGAIARVQALAKEQAASESHVASFINVQTAFQLNRSPQNALSTADAYSKLNPYDQALLASSQPAAAASGLEARALVRQATAKLARLTTVMASSQPGGNTADGQRALVAAVAEITPFVEGLASEDQKQTIAKARVAARAGAWAFADQALNSIATSENPADYERIASAYALLQTLPQSELNADQQGKLAQMKDAGDRLAASDARLKSLFEAYDLWQKDGISNKAEIIDAIGQRTPLDQKRLTTPAQKHAWDELTKADDILRGPEIGFSVANSARFLIFSQVTGAGPRQASILSALAGKLRDAGLSVAPTKSQAALVLDIDIAGQNDLGSNLQNFVTLDRVITRSSFSLAWRVNGAVVVAKPELTTPGDGDNPGQATACSLINTLDEIVKSVASSRSGSGDYSPATRGNPCSRGP